MIIAPGGIVYARFTTQSPDGAAADFDEPPLAVLHRNGAVLDAEVDVTALAIGLSLATVALPASSPGDQFEIEVSGTIAGTAARGIVWRGVTLPDVAAGALEDRVEHVQDILAGITSLRDWLRLALRSDAAAAAPAALAELNGAEGSYSPATDSLKAIRNRGDGAWVGGSGVVQVLPIVTSVQTQPVRPSPLVAYARGSITHRVAVFDSTGAPLSLAGKTLQFVLETRTGSVVGMLSVSVDGADANVAVMAVPEELHFSTGLFRYAVRDLADGARVWLHGDYLIEPAAGPHA
ncbi:MAG: hypothetical protein KF774_20485 [Planctomyces sp.]|nr:hypothetical protein [Planctomyces sp.]